MNFINPFVLFGLLAASIPVLLHLLNLRKLKTVDFSSLKFLKELQKSKIRKLKIKQILLLILRTLIIVFIVLAFARPIIKGTIPGFESYAKSSIVILLDNSKSMDLSDEFGNRFTQAKKSAEAIISSLKDGDEAVVIEMSATKNNDTYSFSKNISLLKEKINQTKLSNETAEFDRALSLANLILEDAGNFNKEIFVVSDAQSNIFTAEDSLKIKSKDIGLYLVPIGYNSKASTANLSIDSIYVSSRIFEQGKPIEVVATIKNHNSLNITGASISMTFNGQRVAQRTFDLPAGEQKSISIAGAAFETGAVAASLEIEPDAQAIDNKRYFSFVVPDQPKVAVVGSNETNKFVSIVLGSGSDKPIFQASYYTSDNFANIDLNNIDCIIITDPNFENNDIEILNNYIKKGGSALIFANDGIESKALEFGIGNGKLKSFSETSKAQFIGFDKDHPLFDGVFNPTSNNKDKIESPRILKAAPSAGGISIIEMQGGSFLAENSIEEGKIIYCAVPPTLEWSSLPVTSIFPALVYRSVFYMSSTRSLGKMFEIGSNQSVTIAKKYSSSSKFKIIDPSGNEIATELPLLPAGAVLSTADWLEPGVYVLRNSDNQIAETVALNISKYESQAAGKDKTVLENHINSRFVSPIDIQFLDNTNNLSKDLNRARIGTELWQLFVLLAIMCAFAEMIVEKASKQDLGE